MNAPYQNLRMDQVLSAPRSASTHLVHISVLVIMAMNYVQTSAPACVSLGNTWNEYLLMLVKSKSVFQYHDASCFVINNFKKTNRYSNNVVSFSQSNRKFKLLAL